MENLNNQELLVISGGHDGASYNAGVATRRWVNGIVAETASNMGDLWDAFWGGVALGLAKK